MHIFKNFSEMLEYVSSRLKSGSHRVESPTWHSQPSGKIMRECLNINFQVIMQGDYYEWAKQLKANLPWADEHFLERVSGVPVNPPPSHVNWPYAKKENGEHTKQGQFSHTYPERFWPKKAGNVISIESSNKGLKLAFTDIAKGPLSPDILGIRYRYGDLNDTIEKLLLNPLTRQAFIPIWFPEDTGLINERVPCTLGYHLIMRNNRLHINYYMRSCDFMRHFRDDIYMAARLADWVLKKLRNEEFDIWGRVELGFITVSITSLHLFEEEHALLK